MSAYERRLLRKQINRKLYNLANKESQENDFLNSSQLITERQQMYMVISKHFRELENKRTSKKRIPFPIESTSLPHVNLGRTNRLLNITKAITSKSAEIDKVLVAHSYRTATPYYTNPELTVERGNFMNYSQHIGTLLHTPQYISFLNSFRESKSSRSGKKSNNDFMDYVSSSSSDQSSNSHKTYSRSKSSNSSNFSNKTLERKNEKSTEDSDSVTLHRELSSTSLDLSISNAESASLSNDKKVPSEKSSSVLSPSENQLKGSSTKEGRTNSSRVSREKRTDSSRNCYPSDKNKIDNVSLTGIQSDLSCHNKNETASDMINNDNRKSTVSNKSSEKIISSNELSAVLTRPDERNQSPHDKDLASKKIQIDEDLEENVTDVNENNDTSNLVEVNPNKYDQNMSLSIEGCVPTPSNVELPKESKQEVFFSHETKDGFSITSNETHNLSSEEEEGADIQGSNEEIFNFEMNDNFKANFMSEMEEFLYSSAIAPNEPQVMKSYFDTINHFQITNSKYVKDYYKFSVKYHQGNFINFAKICNKYPVYTLNQDEVKRIKNLIEECSLINPGDERNKSHIETKPVDVLVIRNEETIIEIDSELKSPQNDKIQNDMEKKDIDKEEKIESKKGENEEIKQENICLEENISKDEDEDFSEAFQKLFRNSIAEISKEDLEAIKRLAENCKVNKNDIEEEQYIPTMHKDSEVLLNDSKQSMESSGFDCNEIEKDESLVEHASRRHSKDDIKEQSETTNNEVFIKNEYIESKETDSQIVKEEIKSNLLEDSNIESEEENEILRNFRHLFRTSIDNIKDEDLEKVNQIIGSFEKQYNNL